MTGPKPPGGRPPLLPRPRHLHLSRRAFLGAAGIAIAGGAAAAYFGLGDNGGGEVEDVAGTFATPRSTPAKSAPSTRGGRLRSYTLTAAPYDTLDPHLTQGGPITDLHAAVYSRLLRFDDEVAGTIAPDLAEGLPEQPDETTYVFHIRDGIRFHNTAAFRASFPATAGRLLTADDVRLSIERQRNGNSPQARRFYRRDAWDLIDSIEVPDARTLIIRTSEPVAPMLPLLAGRHAFVIPREVLDREDALTNPTAVIGTGPFVLDGIEDGVAVRLQRNRRWFAADLDAETGPGRPFLTNVDLFMSPQEDAFQRAAFERKIVDSTGFVDQTELATAHKTNLEDIALQEIDAGAIIGLRLLLDRPPFLDDRARKALHLAIDRTAIAEAMYPEVDGAPSARLTGAIAPGAARWALDGETLARKPGYRTDTEGRANDLAEARALWQAATGPDAVDLPIAFAGIPRVIPDRAVETLRTQLREALGVNVISRVDPAGQVVIGNALLRNLESATEGAVTCAFIVEDGGVDLDDWLYPHFHSGGATNTYRLQDPQLDDLLDAQRREFDFEARQQIGRDAQEYLLANVNARIEICAPVERRLVWGYVRNTRMPFWYGAAQDLADVWLDESHPAFAARPPAI